MKTAAALGSLLCLLSCGPRDRPPPEELASLEPGVAARVGDEAVSVELVRMIAREQRVDLPVARDRAISDALFAVFARERFASTGHVESAERGAYARALLEGLRQEAERGGPPTDAEVAEITELRWSDLARPPMARTTHVVIRATAPEKRTQAAPLAAELAEKLRDVRDPDEFERRAKAFDAHGLEVVVEKLHPVAEDGRVLVPGAPPGSEPQRYAAEFARAANALANVGDQSPVVESDFGFHVILLLEKIPAASFPLETRRALVQREVMQRRASALQGKLVDELRKAMPVTVDRAAESLVAEIQVSR